ncbi:ribosomal RNA small subunit methyltransferase A [Candidatus Giovannonibacteria bacterium RIFCSPHIGHO2_02_FULL_46_20]|uniref:Ribosomal RNA small subunit methyltransferase A n=1 Tax=Candidatus Giovannonibacteria bacterium RIFCSPHIGHO2_02_FULL_46_20 TaxID=1798338 RepID=A0A1F5WH14_9BACT|nr:MAG: ribosomal RNA small subunit methyltransferase A [Candidatus Giovannonibacteria bacterium RIFCSPHIGHO2_02_FULL_46_20]
MINPKKKFGQHFLSNRSILETMVRAARITKRDTVLEIGPGMGSLTERLAKYAKKVIAIEKDRDLIPLLKEKFATTPNVEIIEGDILKIFNAQFPIFNQESIKQFPGIKSLKHSLKIKNFKLKIVANIPYYITGRFLRFVFEQKTLPSSVVLMIQREVAERIVGNPSTRRGVKESLLSLSVKVYGTPKIIRVVPRGAFNPPPKVDSAIIAIENISDAWFIKNSIKPADFFAILKRAFQNKRKMLKNSLHDTNTTKFATRRPEELSLNDWADLL